MPAAHPRRHLSRLLRRRRYLSMQVSSRMIVDVLRFGKGTIERMGAACVLSAAFFFSVMAAGMIAGVEPVTGAIVAALAFLIAAVTLNVFVLGKSDEQLAEGRDALAGPIDEARAEVAAAQAEEERAKELREREDDDRRGPRRTETHRESDRRERDDDDDGRRPARRPKLAACPYCREMIGRDAVKCGRCGEWLDESYRPKPAKRSRGVSGGIAALLSFLFVGAGQIARGRVVAGLLWMFVTAAMYALTPCTCFTLFLAIILHVVCILDAAADY